MVNELRSAQEYVADCQCRLEKLDGDIAEVVMDQWEANAVGMLQGLPWVQDLDTTDIRHEEDLWILESEDETKRAEREAGVPPPPGLSWTEPGIPPPPRLSWMESGIPPPPRLSWMEPGIPPPPKLSWMQP